MQPWLLQGYLPEAVRVCRAAEDATVLPSGENKQGHLVEVTDHSHPSFYCSCPITANGAKACSRPLMPHLGSLSDNSDPVHARASWKKKTRRDIQ